VKLTALVKRPDPEAGMGGCRGIKRRRDWQTFPEGVVISDARGKGIHRNIAERVVDEMAEQVGEQNQPTSQTDLPDADAADIFVKRHAIELCYAHNRRKTEDASHHQSRDRTNSRLFLQTPSLQDQSFALRTRKSVPKASVAIEPLPADDFRPASAFGYGFLVSQRLASDNFSRMTPRSCSRGFRVIFAARSPRSIGSLLGLLDAATMHRTPNAGAAVIFARHTTRSPHFSS